MIKDQKRAELIYQKLVAGGLSENAAKGIIGNLSIETGGTFDPMTKQGNNGKGRGIAQWSTGGRYDTDPINLLKYAEENNKNPNELDTQVNFMLHEMNTHPEYMAVKKALNEAKTPTEASEIFAGQYEKAGTPHQKKRNFDAENFMPAQEEEREEFLPEVQQPAPQQPAPTETVTGGGESTSYDGQSAQLYDWHKNDYDLGEVKFPRELQGALEKNTLFAPDSTPNQLAQPVEGAGFLKSAFHTFAETNELVAGGRYLYEHSSEWNPHADDLPPNWTPYEVDNYVGVPEKYWPLIGTARSPQELDTIKAHILESSKRDEEVENGSFLGKLIGGIAGYVTSPTSLIPMASVARYAKTSDFILKNMVRMAPGMTMQAAAHNAFMESLKANPSIANALEQTVIDGATGTALAGLGLTVASRKQAVDVYNARKALGPMTEHGIYPLAEVNEAGELTGRMIATPSQGSSASAREVDFAQEILDSTIAAKGIFASQKITNIVGKISPMVRGLSNRFPSARLFLGRGSDHSFITEGTEAGRARPDNYGEKIYQYRGETALFINQLRGIWHEANGIRPDGSASQKVKALQQRMTKSRMFSWEEFSKAVHNVLISGEQHSNKSVNEAAELLKKHQEEVSMRMRNAYGIDDPWAQPKTAADYFSRAHNHKEMITRENEWLNIIANEYKTQDEKILELKAPARAKRSEIKQLNEQIAKLEAGDFSKSQIKRLKAQIPFKEAELAAYEANLSDRILNEPDLWILADNHTHLSHSEAETVKGLVKQRNVLQEQLNALAAKLEASENKEANAAIEEEMRKIEKTLDDENVRLHQMAHNKEISRRLYDKNYDTGEITFKDPELKLKLRPTFKNHKRRTKVAKQYFDSILNQTTEDVQAQVLDQFTKGSDSMPTKARTFLVRDKVLFDNNFLHSDLQYITNAYDAFMNKRTALKETFADVSIEGGIEPIIANVKNEFEAQKAELFGIKDKAKREKALQSLQKEFDSTISDMKNLYRVIMGRSAVGKKARDFLRGMNNLTYASKAGAIPLTQQLEIGALMMQLGIWPTIREGLIPAFKSLGGLIKTKQWREMRMQAAQAQLAIEDLLGHSMTKHMNPTFMEDLPGSSKFLMYSNVLAEQTSKFALTEGADNLLQTIGANIAQGNIMRYMHDFKAGKLSKANRQELLQYGLEPERWADRFVKGWEEAGAHGSHMTGYSSRFFTWSDIDAGAKMSQAVRRGVRSAILKSSEQSMPYSMNNPIGRTIFMFKGWGFEALNRYTLPALQQMTARKFAGITLMLALGGTVAPLRRITRGEDPIPDDMNDEEVFWQAFVDSGIAGILPDGIEILNGMVHGKLLGKAQNDKYRDRNMAGIVQGAPMGMAEDMRRVFAMIATGTYNENDMKRMARLLPYTNYWYMRGVVNKAIEDLGLPKTYRRAEKQNQ